MHLCAEEGKTTFPFFIPVLCLTQSAVSCKFPGSLSFPGDVGSKFHRGTEQVDGDIFTFLHRREDRRLFLYCEQKA